MPTKQTKTKTAPVEPTKAKTNKEQPELYAFTQGFFEFFGAPMTHLNGKQPAGLHVQLTPELVTHFERNELHLAFHQAALPPGHELVSHGSRVFDRMLTYLDQRGAATFQQLPSRFGGGEELLKAVRPVNAGIANLKMQEQTQQLYAFNWRITYRADDKREEFYTVVLDESGTRLALSDETNAATTTVDLDQLCRDAEPMPPEKNDEGQLVNARLPAMTQLVRLAENARKYAIYHADLRCVSHEAEILPRLYKALSRLTTYYEQQIEETHDAHDPDGEKRTVLEADLQRKIQEEIENHRLRVQVKLISYLIFQVPVAVADLTLSDGQQESVVRVRRNRYNGVLRRPACHSCGEETTTVALDRNGHPICDNCIQQCGSCQAIVCATCGVTPCPACGKQNCAGCGGDCWACGERACTEHISPCPACGDSVCHGCQAECAGCGVLQCRSHLRIDHVRAGQGEAALLCAACAVRCPGCQQYSAQLGLCSASGQRFCTNCLVACVKCGQRFGSGFYQVIDDQPYCTNCLDECPTCHKLTAHTNLCPTCGKAACPHCGGRCATCQQSFCQEHIHRFKTCGHSFCSEHAAHCHICQTALCTACEPTCGICEQAYCQHDKGVCLQCGCTYCRECIRRSGLCDTCAMFEREAVRVEMTGEPCGTDPAVAPLIRHYYWRRATNAGYTLYIGEGALLARIVIVTRQEGNKHKVVSLRRVGTLESILGRFRR